nr:aspartate 4-decarboxylase [uncultured Niameybacter sp.]
MMTCPTRGEVESLYHKISGFEFKEILINIARNSREGATILDAGRGNPNWTATLPRQAFFAFGQFAVLETQHTWKAENLAGMPSLKGIGTRLERYLKAYPDLKIANFIREFIDYGVKKLGFNQELFIYELAHGIIGDQYPFPDRSLVHIEKVVKAYLMKELCPNREIPGEFHMFSVEGGAAGMCYLFNSLMHNHLLHKGDKIALMTPIFTPYLEIPELPEYEFETVYIRASRVEENGRTSMQYTKEALDVLKDPEIKVVFIVNPNNPLSTALSDTSKNYLVQLVKEERPDLMIVTDDVYSTFVPRFCSLIADLPYNTLCIYSLSKYFGVTGWRLGTVLLHEENVFDASISKLEDWEKEELEKRYNSLGTHAKDVKFIDRMVADSRLVALNHTAGLSTPQQVQMAFFCGFALMDEGDAYKKLTRRICKKRKRLLYEGMQRELITDPYDAYYYTEVDVAEWIESQWGVETATEIINRYKCVDFLYELAHTHNVILLAGDGFASSKWTVRVSLANLEEGAYPRIGRAMYQVLQKWVKEVKSL